MNVPVRARPASTLVLVRDGPDNDQHPLEVLLVRRNERADFVGGAHVFPGGGVDAADRSAEVAMLAVGRRDDEASTLLGLVDGGLAYWVAAVRECFEEAGVLLAYRQSLMDDGSERGSHGGSEGGAAVVGPANGGGADALLTLTDPAEQERFEGVRAELNGGRKSFVDVCRSEGFLLALDRIHYFAHWITPEPSPRRYDTRFFVAAMPGGQIPRSDAREIVEETWIRPADALVRHRDGEIDLILPTVRTLQTLSTFDRAGDLLTAAARVSAAADRPARMVAQGRGLRIVLPNDPEGVDDGPGGSR